MTNKAKPIAKLSNKQHKNRLHEGSAPPSVGDDIYVAPSAYIGHGEDDKEGGLGEVVKVGLTIFGRKVKTSSPFVYVKEHPGTGYNWGALKDEQEKLKKRYGKSRAYLDPDLGPIESIEKADKQCKNKLHEGSDPQIEAFNKQVLAFGEELVNNSEFILQELPNVGLPEDLRLRVFNLCRDDLKGAWTSLFSAVTVDRSTQTVEGRARLMDVLRETLTRVHGLILDLRTAAEKDSRLGGAQILVEESATNMWRAFHKVLDVSDPPVKSTD